MKRVDPKHIRGPKPANGRGDVYKKTTSDRGCKSCQTSKGKEK